MSSRIERIVADWPLFFFFLFPLANWQREIMKPSLIFGEKNINRLTLLRRADPPNIWPVITGLTAPPPPPSYKKVFLFSLSSRKKPFILISSSSSFCSDGEGWTGAAAGQTTGGRAEDGVRGNGLIARPNEFIDRFLPGLPPGLNTKGEKNKMMT